MEPGLALAYLLSSSKYTANILLPVSKNDSYFNQLLKKVTFLK